MEYRNPTFEEKILAACSALADIGAEDIKVGTTIYRKTFSETDYEKMFGENCEKDKKYFVDTDHEDYSLMLVPDRPSKLPNQITVKFHPESCETFFRLYDYEGELIIKYNSKSEISYDSDFGERAKKEVDNKLEEIGFPWESD